MQNRLYIIILTLTMFLGACKKDFLDRTPETSISEAEFWKTQNDLQLYVNNFYTAFPSTIGAFGTIGPYGLDADDGSDNMITMSVNSNMNGVRTIPSSGGGWAYGDWNTLRNINYFMVNYNKVNASWENQKTYVGEALFFRAWFYFSKLRQFGDLPWVNRPLDITSGELKTPRLSRSVIVDSIMNDLDRAVQYLPSKTSAQASRVNKQIAQLFQARIALFEGTWEKYHTGTPFGVNGADGTKFLQKAATVSADLIANPGGYALVATPGTDGYWRIFNQINYSSNSEVMLWRQFDLNINGGHYWHRYTNTGAGRGITKNLVDYYLCTDGKPITGNALYQGDASLLNVIKNRDPRMVQTIYINDGNHIVTNNRPNGAVPNIFDAPTFSAANEQKPATGYQVYKGHDPDYNQQQDRGTSGYIIFRFAEALLIYAEAKAELATITQNDLDISVNKLRARIGMPNMQLASITADPKWEFPALSPVINEVRRERRVELACEGYRKDDIFRWAAADELIVGWKPKGAKLAQWIGVVDSKYLTSYPVDENGYIELFKTNLATGYKFNLLRDYLSPIPTDQMVLNPDIKQNPGWQ
ncbi:RagB/SusD family nutrient uptake outer membrane protein [Pedobacter sp. HDW13]|uniref:RagB/SusD family nutrient uptake outer membrane protein n=1 Tax=Pedobacter sp. HDW13 TaxID=2714940 RepID=UPI00140AAEAA|nr:RagB/SusD family nutrient uptake outer membrane protein [Pedobacter sp. HDW13]QIL41558.1 RagB/SusD family nutrient uptake outer membrane protein [Pedobacter sp. HDW13]